MRNINTNTNGGAKPAVSSAPQPDASKVQAEVTKILAELEVEAGCAEGPKPLPNTSSCREIPKLSSNSRIVLEQLADGNIEGFLDPDQWVEAVSDAAAEALDVANVSEGGLSYNERLPALKAQMAEFARTLTAADHEETAAVIRESNAAMARVLRVEVVGYMRSNSVSGAYAMRVIWPVHFKEEAVYFPNITGPELDRAALVAGNKRLVMLRGLQECPLPFAEHSAKRLNARRPKGWKNVPPGGAVRERIRGGRLELSCELGKPSVYSLSTGVPVELEELAMRAYWSRRSIN